MEVPAQIRTADDGAQRISITPWNSAGRPGRTTEFPLTGRLTALAGAVAKAIAADGG